MGRAVERIRDVAMSGDAPLSNATNANAPDGQMNDQEMPTTDGQMASNTSEESIPPRSPRDDGATGEEVTPNGHD